MSYFVITTSTQGITRRQIWDASKPFAIGHPFRWVLEHTAHGIRIRDLQNNNYELKKIKSEVNLSHLHVIIHPKKTLSAPTQIPALSAEDDISQQISQKKDPIRSEFLQSMRTPLLTLCLFSLMTWLWPKPSPQTRELVPAQYAKIILSSPQHKNEAKNSATKSAIADNAKRAQDTATARALRAKELQSAISGLLKGGMTKLLSHADFTNGADSSAHARRIFNTKTQALQAMAPRTNGSGPRTIGVSTLGGDHGSSHNGQLIGYGKGAHAEVIGQGRTTIALDTGGSAVEEGLTKDEVGEVIHRHLSEIRYCYESAMLKTPDLEGKLIVQFMIGNSGGIKTAAIKTSTLPDPRLDDCILRRLITWKFPSPKGSIDVAVSYPFIFKTLGR